MTMETPLVELAKVSKSFQTGNVRVDALKDVSWCLGQRRVAVVCGHNGSGKSTLLHCVGGLIRPDTGCIRWRGKDVSEFRQSVQARYHNEFIGFVFQRPFLVANLSASLNVALPLLVRGVPTAVAYSEGAHMLKILGLKHRLDHRPHELSGGEMQKICLGRALVRKPALVIADEPTSSLDPESSDSIVDLLVSLVERYEASLLLVTHAKSVVQRVHSKSRLVDVCHMREGRMLTSPQTG